MFPSLSNTAICGAASPGLLKEIAANVVRRVANVQNHVSPRNRRDFAFGSREWAPRKGTSLRAATRLEATGWDETVTGGHTGVAQWRTWAGQGCRGLPGCEPLAGVGHPLGRQGGLRPNRASRQHELAACRGGEAAGRLRLPWFGSQGPGWLAINTEMKCRRR